MPRISRDWIAGGILLIVGSFELALTFLPDVAFLIPLLLGLGLLGLFLVLRSPAFLSAGGVISGIGVGILTARQGDPDLAGAGVLVSIGFGFVLVSILGAIYDVHSVRTWPLVPGSALIAVGAVIFATGLGPGVLDLAVRGWPAVPVIVGSYLLLAARLRLPLYADDAEPVEEVPDETHPVPTGRHQEQGPQAPTMS